MSFIKKEEIVLKVKEIVGDNSQNIDVVCDTLINVLFDYIKKGESITCGENHQMIKTKIKISHKQDCSPRIMKNDYIYASIKIPLDTKGGIKIK